MTRVSTIKVLAVYWALLAFGITIYTAIRSDALAVLAPVWLGTFVGTLVGQTLALRRAHGWLLLLVIVGGGMLWIPQLPDSIALHPVWMAYVPAALCGYWVLGDRTSLLAFWFPAMIWMLSILDGTGPSAVPDATGLLLLGALALMFVVYLRVREERRIALWRSVSLTPLAVTKPPVLLHEGASAKLPRIAWAVAMSALGFAATMWLAPRMWKAETFDGGHFQVASNQPQFGVPCCPHHAIAPATRGRLKEYFDLGRGHEQIGAPEHEVGCRVCAGNGGGIDGPEIQIPPEPMVAYTGGDYESTFQEPAYPHAYRGGGGGLVAAGGDATGYPDTAITQAPYIPPAPYVPPAPTQYAPQLPPAASEQPHVPSHLHTPPVRTSPPPPPPAPRPTPHVAPVPPPPIAPPIVAPPAPIVTPPAATPPTPPHAAPSKLEAPELAAEPAPEVRTPSQNPGVVLRWAAILLGTLLLGQLIALALRPVRRAIALRHLERPFWNETVDQRISNAWQLALIGLRDGGWRTSAHESPGALAKRVDLPGLDRCATILERARHGVGIDHDDLADMTSSAAAVYRDARTHATPFARTVAWLRWPLA
ncbi:MAG: hypothetical protein ABI591_25305 [Kofleriaceae bacterium]